MFEINYTVKRIDGDYAILVAEDGVENPVARALLPDGIDEGTLLLCKDFEYSIRGEE